MSKASNLMEKNAGFVANWLSNLDQLRYNIAKKRHEEGKHVFNKKLIIFHLKISGESLYLQRH